MVCVNGVLGYCSDDLCIVLVLTAAEQKCLKRGVKEVVKSIRRGHKGSVFFFKCIYIYICKCIFICGFYIYTL